jgi:hypothetical protein
MNKIQDFVHFLQTKYVQWFNNFFGKKSWEKAIEECKTVAGLTQKKMWIISLHGEFVAVPKSEFKQMWHNNPRMKFRTIQEWQKYIYEFNDTSQTAYPCGIKYKSS